MLPTIKKLKRRQKIRRIEERYFLALVIQILQVHQHEGLGGH
tara:strand:+ start:175 stop:300 length:126 start_codon:yes stop_codon:yes gene_type:complete